MPKQFGHKACTLAVVMVAFCFAGCRTTTEKMAGLPGLSWLERDDEGWARYEPAPGLPRPSSSSEPTGVESPSSSIAIGNGEEAKAPYGQETSSPTTTTSVASSETGARFDASRYAPNKSIPSSKTSGSSTRSNTGSKYGDYASAYGKYGPPKSLGDSNIATQKGPYDIPASKYSAPATTSGSTAGYDALAGSKYVKPSSAKPTEEAPATPQTSDSKKSPYGYVDNNRFDNALPKTGTDSEPAAAYTATSTSRFGAPNNSLTSKPKASTYTPPGFVTSPKPSATASANRFGAVPPKAANQATAPAQQAADNPPFNTAKNQLNTVPNGFGQQSGELVNKFANSAKQTTDSYATAAKSTFDNAAQNVVNQGKQKIDAYAETATQTTNQYLNAAKDKFAATTAGAGTTAANVAATTRDKFNTFAGNSQATSNSASTPMNSLQTAANNAVGNATKSFDTTVSKASQYVNDASNRFTSAPQNSLQSAAPSVQQQATGQLNGLAQGAKNTLEQSANSAYQQSKSTFNRYANSAASNVKSGVDAAANAITNSQGNGAGSASGQGYVNTAGNKLNQTRESIQGYASAAGEATKSVMHNVSASGQPAYPSTNTPNPFVLPSASVSGARTSVAPRSNASPTHSAPTSSNPTMQRNVSPFLPGSTSTFKGATNTQKPLVKLASNESSRRQDVDEHLVLAVGNKYDFPRTIR